jgi:hypothetical protein
MDELYANNLKDFEDDDLGEGAGDPVLDPNTDGDDNDSDDDEELGGDEKDDGASPETEEE